MDRNRDRCVQEAMAEADNKITVRRYCGRCPIGGCSKAGQNMGIGYEDNGELARQKVWNHVRYSPKHEDMGFDTDEAVDDFLDANESSWLQITNQQWDQEEFDQLQADQRGDANEPDNSVPEPAGKPSAKPKTKGKGKGKLQEGKKGGNNSLENELRWQIQRQTANMFHFSKAASTCISALRVAANMCDQASRTFTHQKEAMEEGMDAMIDAFGIEPPSRSRNKMNPELCAGASSTQMDLARQVRRGGPY